MTPHSRPYRADRRADSAAQTRAAILRAAIRLFVEHGYGKVTVNDIAREASAAVPTVYASTGGKAAILATIIDEAARDPIVDETLAAVRECTDPEDVIRVVTHGVRVDNERHHDIVRVMLAAAALDEAAAGTLARSNELYRRALGEAAERLEAMRALKPAVDRRRAIDILWFFLGHHSWHLCASELGWSWDEAEEWLTERISSALLTAT
ncbi:TetR/AcrR family transcriptional regulator [Microbispora sp. NPDC049125]|uniref:TetR/AcrR family transcriptional regulator n=1 Tax=Microbispora sp. NPDC049125 TaxID=3154929 RepID=UPI0034656B9F